MPLFTNSNSQFGKELITIGEWLQSCDSTFSHTLSPQIQAYYFKLFEKIMLGNAVIYEKALVDLSSNTVILLTNESFDVSAYNTILRIGQISMPGYSRNAIPEVLYNLDKIFDRASYTNAKHYTNTVKYPLNLAKRYNYRYEKLTEETLPIAKEIHDAWVARKLADPKTHRISFSTNRYYRCAVEALRDPNAIVMLGYIENKPFSLEVMLRHNNVVYAASSVNLFFQEGFISNSSQMARIYLMKYLKDAGVQMLNFGQPNNPGLKHFKLQYPDENFKVQKYIKKEII